MQVNQFRFLTVEDPCDKEFNNWSRCYEWNYVLQQLQMDTSIKSIHNSCCGPGDIHKQFVDRLSHLNDKNILNTDMNIPLVDIAPFIKWDMRQPFHLVHDCVLCISTLEELKSTPDDMVVALNNLYNAANKRLIVTFDYPDVPLELIEDWVGQKCTKAGEILNGSNSVYRNDHHKHLSIVLLDVNKDK